MNMFACLDDSDNDETPVQKVATKTEEKAALKKESANVKKEAAPAAPSASSNNKAPKTDAGAPSKKKEGDVDRKPKDATRKENFPAANIREEIVKVADVDGAVSKDENRGGRKNGKPERRRGDNEKGERRDSTGRSGAQHKGGRGSYSFGNVSDEARLAEINPAAALVESVVVLETEEAVAAPADAPEVPVEPVVITLTFDEAIAKRNESRANTEYFGEIKNIRAVDTTALPGKEVVPESVEVELIGMAKVAKSARHSNQRSTTKTQVLELGFKTVIPDQGGDDDRRGPRAGRGEGRGGGEGRGFSPREGGGRGGGRGGRGGGERSPRPQSSYTGGGRGDVPVINDASFPSL